MKYKAYLAAFKRDVAVEYAKGVKVIAIAAAFGVPRSTVIRWAREAGLAPRDKSRPCKQKPRQ